MKLKFILLYSVLFSMIHLSFGQKGKDGDVTISSEQIVNVYKEVTNIQGAVLTVNNTTNLAIGDYVMIIQMYGVEENWEDFSGYFGSTGTGLLANQNAAYSYLHAYNYARFNQYTSGGLHEFAEIRSVSTSAITVQCSALKNNYDLLKVVQVVKIPRYNNLTINNGGVIKGAPWNGKTGGIIALEVNGTFNLNTGATAAIDATGIGYRGGKADGNNGTSNNTHSNPLGAGDAWIASIMPQTAFKGESAFGDTVSYRGSNSSKGRSPFVNGGGGGGIQNAGGGGGSNIGFTGNYRGRGVLPDGATTAWNLEQSTNALIFWDAQSSGGGRGGHAFAEPSSSSFGYASPNYANVLTTGPNNNAWNGSRRKEEGGLGGNPLPYNKDHVFLGGGGGAGHQDSWQGGSGGNGGGIICIFAYGDVTGSGRILAKGADGGNSNPNNEALGSATKKGNDGAGGAGGGGSIIIKNTNPITSANIVFDASGGKGGDFRLSRLSTSIKPEICGPGGGGQGGLISFNQPVESTMVNGGAPGTALISTAGGAYSTILSQMPSNGATKGGVGIAVQENNYFYITVEPQEICGPGSVTFSVQTHGVVPQGTTYTWHTTMTSTGSLGTGATFTRNVTTTTTYWVRVCPGNYRVPVTVTVNPLPAITTQPTLVQPTCSGAGSITGIVASGSQNTYQWSNGANTLNLPSLAAGDYTLTITNEFGCTTTSPTYSLIGVGAPALVTPPSVTAKTCTTNGALAGMVVNAAGPYTITLNGTTVTGFDHELAPGSYTFVVTDVNSCIGTFGPYVINEVLPPVISGTPAITDATCLVGGSIGGLIVSATPGLTYSWNGTTYPTAVATDLAAGSYTLTVTDANGCTVTSGPHVVTTEPVPSIAGTATVVQPNCLAGGNITGLSASGGVGNLTLSWAGSTATTYDLYNIPAGSYTLTVTDENGCTASSGPYNLLIPTSPIITGTAVIAPITCHGNGGVTGLSVSGGTAPYVYMYNTTPSASAELSTGTAGTYMLNVGDANGCIVSSGPYVVPVISLPTVNGLTASTNANCNEDGTASFTNLSGGQAPLTALWSDNVTTTNTATLPAGTYTVTVTDDIGCSSTSAPITIGMDAPPTLNSANAVVTQLTCDAPATITGITVSGGIFPLTYAWNGTTSTNANLLTNSAGSYVLTVTDVNGCSATSAAFPITNPSAPSLVSTPTVTNITCVQDGSISNIQIAGGTAPFVVQWNGAVTNDPYTLTTGTAGQYTLTVTDANNCVFTDVYTLTAAPLPILGGNAVITDVECTTPGTITGLTVSNGTAPYAYSWNGVITNTIDMLNASAGGYALTVTDANGCTATGPTLTVGQDGNIPTLNTNPVVVQPTCIDQGAISGYTINGGSAPFTYSWTGSNATTPTLTNLAAGTYVLTVTDANGCVVSGNPIQLVDPSQPSIGGTANITPATCLEGGDLIGLTINGGTQPFTYTWNGTLGGIDLQNMPAGSYTLVVEDANGCQVTGNYVITSNVTASVEISYEPSPAVINENTVFTANSTSNLSGYTWVVGDVDYETGLSSVDSIFSTGGNVIVSVTAMDPDGCVVMDTITVLVYSDLIIPNVITANGDGVNDFFYLGPVLPNTSVLILDRWGNVVFESDDYKNQWNATDRKGKPVSDGVYTYVIKTMKGEQYHGFVTVVDSQK